MLRKPLCAAAIVGTLTLLVLGWGEDIRLKTPSSGISQKTPSSGVLRSNIVLSEFASPGNSTNETAYVFGPDERDDNNIIYPGVHIPLLLRNPNTGTLLAIAEGRAVHRSGAGSDQSSRSIVYKRSTDDGETWGTLKVIWTNSNFVSGSTFTNLTSGVVDPATGRIFVMMATKTRIFTTVMSADDGLTWTKLDGSALSGLYGGTIVDVTSGPVVGEQPYGLGYINRSGSIASVSTGNPTIIVCSAPHNLTNFFAVKIDSFTAPGFLNHESTVAVLGVSSFTVAINSSGTTVTGSGKWSGMWGWTAGPGSPGVALQNGWLMMPGHHRFTADTAGNSYSHSWVCKNPSASTPTWQLHGGLDETATGNAGTNENTIAQMNDGSLIMSIRHQTVGNNYRYQSTSTVGSLGLAWSTAVAKSSDLVGVASNGSLAHTSDDFLYLAYPGSVSDTTTRSRFTIAYSSNGGTNWLKNYVITYKYGGYGSLQVSPTKLYCLYEAGQVKTDPQTAVNIVAGDNVSFFKSSIRYPRLHPTTETQIILPFNDDSNGTYTNYLGPALHDHGGHDWRIIGGQPSSLPRYKYDVSQNGIVFVSTGMKIGYATLQGLSPDANESMTWEMVFNSTSNTFCLFTTRPDSAGAGGQGVSLELNAAGRMVGTLCDGTFTPTITGTTVINDGDDRAVALVRNKSSGKLELWINGVKDATDVNDTTTGNCHQLVQDSLIGQYTGGTKRPTSLTVQYMRVTRRALGATELLSGPVTNSVKPTLASLVGVSSPTVSVSSSPLSFTLPKLWIYGIGDGGYSMRKGPNGEHMNGVPKLGDVFHSVVDNSDDRWIGRGSAYQGRGMYYSTETLGGLTWGSYYLPYLSSLGTRVLFPNSRSNAGGTVNFDWVQDNPIFSITFCAKFSDVTSSQMIMDNIEGTGSNGGLYVQLVSPGRFRVQISTGGTGTNKFQETITHTALSINQWYFVGIVANGAGDNVDVWIKAIDGTPQTLSAGDRTASSTLINNAGGTKISTLDLSIGSINSGGSGLRNTNIRNLTIHQSIFDLPEMQKMYDFNLANP